MMKPETERHVDQAWSQIRDKEAVQPTEPSAGG